MQCGVIASNAWTWITVSQHNTIAATEILVITIIIIMIIRIIIFVLKEVTIYTIKYHVFLQSLFKIIIVHGSYDQQKSGIKEITVITKILKIPKSCLVPYRFQRPTNPQCEEY